MVLVVGGGGAGLRGRGVQASLERANWFLSD